MTKSKKIIKCVVCDENKQSQTLYIVDDKEQL